MRLTFWRACILSLTVAILGAQTPTFDVAVIHPASLPTPDSPRNGQFRPGTTVGTGSADFTFMTLAELLPYAYRVKSFQVTGAGLTQSRWNIQAQFAEGLTDSVPEMMQALLAERFGLKIHREKREQPVYELVVAKDGPKLEASDPSEPDPAPLAQGGFPPFARPEGKGPGAAKGKGGPGGPVGRGPMVAGVLGTAVRMEPNPETCGMRLVFSKLTMSGLADALTPFLDRPVLDGTALTGTYKAALNLPMDVMQSMMQNQMRAAGLPGPGAGGGRGGPGGPGGPGGRAGGRAGGPEGRGPAGCEGGAAGTNSDVGASSQAIFQAVQKLGLRLQARKAPFDTIVVDRFEKTPSEN